MTLSLCEPAATTTPVSGLVLERRLDDSRGQERSGAVSEEYFPSRPPHAPDKSPVPATTTGQRLLQGLLRSHILCAESWEALTVATRAAIAGQAETQKLLELLVEQRLLTEYQATRIRQGKTFGLVLGNYRILERVGAGGMGIIYKGEHLCLRKPVALKVVSVPREENARTLKRFCAERRALALLQHPNIVAALDAGQVVDPDPDAPVLHYLVMEFVPGQDLEAHVDYHGPLDIGLACSLVIQIAGALAAADKQRLIHRDIKPSNILLTPAGTAKLLDFGLVHLFGNRLTEPHTALGTIDYMPPEQAGDACAVDIRADIYALGGTLFWCLTGRPPFLSRGNITRELIQRRTQAPPSLRAWRSEVPVELEKIVQRMMATNPYDRYPTPQAVAQVLFPFSTPATPRPKSEHRAPARRRASVPAGAGATPAGETVAGSAERALERARDIERQALALAGRLKRMQHACRRLVAEAARLQVLSAQGGHGVGAGSF